MKPKLTGITRFGLGIAVGALLLTGCAGTGTMSSQSGSGTDKDGNITLDFWSNHPGNSTAVEKELIKKFEAANPKIKVKLTDAGKNYEEVAQKFNASLAGGKTPDVVVTSDVTWFNFALNKQLVPLSEELPKINVDPSNYVTALYKDYDLNGKIYAVPYARSTPLFYYNKSLWQKAGLPDRGPKSWQEFQTWAPKLKAILGGKPALLLPFGSDYLAWYFQNINWSFGGSYSQGWNQNMTDPNTIKAGEWLQQMVKNGYIATAKTPTEGFAAGQSAALMQSTGSLKGLEKTVQGFELGTAFLPGYEKANVCPTGGAGLAVPAKLTGKRREAAVKFAAFMTNNESTVAFSQATGYMPVTKGALKIKAEKEYLASHPNAKTAVMQLAKTRSQDNFRVLVPGGDQKLGAALDKIVRGANVATTFKDVGEALQRTANSQIKPRLK